MNDEPVPPSIAARLDEIFEGRLFIRHPELAELIGISPTFLRRLGSQGRIGYRLHGKSWRCYTREDAEGFIRSMSEEAARVRDAKQSG